MSRSATRFVASDILCEVARCLAEHEQLGRPLSSDLCGELHAGLLDLVDHVFSLEAIARASGLLDRCDFAAAVTSLTVEDRRALARASLAQAEGSVVPLIPAPGFHGRRVAAELVDVEGGAA